jgi:hypothetical protein
MVHGGQQEEEDQRQQMKKKNAVSCLKSKTPGNLLSTCPANTFLLSCCFSCKR